MSCYENFPPAKKRRTDAKKPPMHSGRWTPEEEQYVEGMITEFNSGLLPVAEGTTLRSFLAKMLNCNPKRVSKKYDGNPIYNGKAAYVRAKNPLPAHEAAARQEGLTELERKFREALLTMQRVESRLQSLTSHLMPLAASSSSKKRSFASIVEERDEASPPTSAASSLVSSLTDEGEHREGVKAEAPQWVEGTSTSVAQVSLLSEKKPVATEAEEAASQVLLQLNSPKKSPPMPPLKGSTLPGSESLFKLTQSPSVKREQAASPVLNISDVPGTNSGELHGLLGKLRGIRQQQSTQQAAAQAPSSLQGLLGLPSPPSQQRVESPLTTPNPQQNLQQLMQALPPPNLQQLTGAVSNCPPQQMDLNSVWQTLSQQQAAQPKPEQDLQSFFGSLMQGCNQGPLPAQQRTAQLQNVFQQIVSGANSAPPPAPQQQQSMQTIIQGLVNQQQLKPHQQQQQQVPQPQSLMNPMPTLPQQQQQPPQQKSALQTLVSNFVNDLQNLAVQQQQAAREQTNVQSVLQSLASVQGTQAPVPSIQAAPKPTDSPNAQAPESLQQLLMQLQQNQASGVTQFQQPRM